MNERSTPLPRTWAEFQLKSEQYLRHPNILFPAEFYETVRAWDWNDIDEHTPTAAMYAKEWLTPLPDTPKTISLTPQSQRGSSSGNQRVSLLGKQRVSEESRRNVYHILNAPDLQTNEDHILRWEQARESDFGRILMSNPIRYCYQDTSHDHSDRTKSIYLQMDNGLQINLTNSNIKALCPLPGNNASTVRHPQQSGPSGNNGRTVIGFNTELGPKN